MPLSLRTGTSSSTTQLFDSEEDQILRSAMKLIERFSPCDSESLLRHINELNTLNENLLAMPSLHKEEMLGGRIRNSTSLIAHLTQSDGLAGDLDLPIKATLQRTFLLAKIQLFRAFVAATTGIDIPSEHEANAPINEVVTELREELAQSIYTQMAEDLLLAMLRKPCIELHIKERAARLLIQIWDNATLEIDDFCPFLESAWHARNRVHPGLGCLLGTTEYFRLVAEDCSDRFLDFFAREGVSEPENQAFAEFLFGLTWEELQTLRRELKAQNIDVCDEDWAAGVLGRTIEHDCDDADNIDPIALYRSYTRRQLAADFRVRSGTPGPRRTAESYLMIYLLDRDELS